MGAGGGGTQNDVFRRIRSGEPPQEDCGERCIGRGRRGAGTNLGGEEKEQN